MTENDPRADEAKGRVKEAAGSLTDDQDLKEEGRTDQAAATVKEKAGQAKEKFDEAVDKVKDTLSGDR